MVDEKDEISPVGEEEYHFTDEQADYDMGHTATQVAAAPRKNLVVRLQENRRILIGVFVFLLLLGVVYRMLIPAGSSSGTTDIVQNVSNSSKAAPVAPSSQKPASTVQESSTPAVAEAATAPPLETGLSTTAATPVAQSQTATAPVSASVVTSDEASSLAARLTNVEQQNTAILNTLQTKYVQRISDIELQNSQLRVQMQDLKAEVSEVKKAFHQLSMLLQKEAMTANTPLLPSNSAGPTVKEVKTAKETGYSVQAIIPGRAWLKSDAGDTVTVAEGDTLRGIGRVVRIDPYDGIVNLDTGHKVITLSYGMGADD